MSRYLIQPREPRDGSEATEPGYSLVPDDYEPQEGENVVSERPKPGEVWDAGAGILRPRTEAEALALEKAEKIDAFARRAVDDLQGLFTDPHGRDELQSLHNAYIVQIAQALGVPVDPRLLTIDEVTQRALAKKEEVLDAGTVEDLEAISWT